MPFFLNPKSHSGKPKQTAQVHQPDTETQSPPTYHATNTRKKSALLYFGRRGMAKRRSFAFALNFSLFLSFLSREKKEKVKPGRSLDILP